jgi:hypothetical protein
MALLSQGPRLAVTMLGDSITNDTGNSPWDALVERAYPNVRLQVATSVRGSTGCWYYRGEGHIRSYVLDFQPDLVIIGGASQKEDIDSITACIDQIRRALPEAEFMLTTYPFYYGDPRETAGWKSQACPDDPTWRGRLMKLAQELKCAYFDMEGAWGDYIRSTDKPIDYFRRDAIHGNERGRMAVAHMLADYFKP